MESVVLRFISNGGYLNFLENDNLDVSLQEIRKRLEEECSDTLSGPSRFLLKGVAISHKQEARLSVRQICSEQVMSNEINSLETSKSVYNVSVRVDGIHHWPVSTNRMLSTTSFSTSQTAADYCRYLTKMNVCHKLKQIILK